ncbi:MAG: hypothetical protein LBP89_03095 [Helicobacteraceae bacterium]|jgi:hypothetical protein|nr:hypothetical protein [Helicobacteraceae bacterium]
MLNDILRKEQKLIMTQLGVFACLITLLLVVGAVVYSKTSIHDRVDAIEQKQSITGGFRNLQQGAE